MTDALSPVPNRRTDNPSASTSSRIDFADFVRQYKMRCSYTHHQMRDLLVLSPLLPHTLYTLSRGNIISYNLLTRKVCLQPSSSFLPMRNFLSFQHFLRSHPSLRLPACLPNPPEQRAKWISFTFFSSTCAFTGRSGDRGLRCLLPRRQVWIHHRFVGIWRHKNFGRDIKIVCQTRRDKNIIIIWISLSVCRIIFEGRTPGTSQLNGCTLCKTENDTLLLICKNSGALQGGSILLNIIWSLNYYYLKKIFVLIIINNNSMAITRDGVDTRIEGDEEL